MSLHRYLVTSDKCPVPYGNAECILVMEEAVDSATISVDSLRFMTTVLFKNPESARSR